MLDSKIVGAKIASLRKKNELSQERLATLLNITPQAISKWENGHSLPDTALLPVLAQIFNCTIDELIMPAYTIDPRIEEEKPNLLQQQAEHIAKYLFQQLEIAKTMEQIPGLDDQTIIQAISQSNPNIGSYTISRSAPEKKPRFTDTYIVVSTPQKEYKLLQRIYSGEDREILGYQLFKDRTFSIPYVYYFDLPSKSILMEDLNKDFIQGFNYDEDNESGKTIRANYKHLIEATAKLHAEFWEDKTTFEQIGLDWRHQSAEHLLAHISAIETDFLVYKEKEENGQIPHMWECFINELDIHKLDYFQEAAEFLKRTYKDVLSSRFISGNNITLVHGDLHPGNTFIAKTPDRTVKFIDLQAIRIGLCTEDLAMLLALHIQPDRKLAEPLINNYYQCLTETVSDYPYEMFINDLRLSIMENMFFPIQLFTQGIYDFSMRDRAFKAFETFVLEDL